MDECAKCAACLPSRRKRSGETSAHTRGHHAFEESFSKWLKVRSSLQALEHPFAVSNEAPLSHFCPCSFLVMSGHSSEQQHLVAIGNTCGLQVAAAVVVLPGDVGGGRILHVCGREMSNSS